MARVTQPCVTPSEASFRRSPAFRVIHSGCNAIPPERHPKNGCAHVRARVRGCVYLRYCVTPLPLRDIWAGQRGFAAVTQTVTQAYRNDRSRYTTRTETPLIEYIGRSGPPEAMNCPALICDTCRKQVVGSGNVIWGSTAGSDGPRRSTPLYVAHKGRCDHAFEKWFAEAYPLADGWMPLWEEAAVFMRQLAYNLTNAFADDTEGTYHPHKLALPKENQ